MPLFKQLRNIPFLTKLGLFLTGLFVLFVATMVILYGIMKDNIAEAIEKELTTTTQLITDMVEATAETSTRNYLRSVADINSDILKELYERQLGGELTEKQAKDEARRILYSQHIGLTGYLYCLNSTGFVVAHPNPKVKDTDVSQWSFVQKQMRARHGYLEYEWQNPGEHAPRQKALYMTYFAPWDWIISVTAYKSEFNQLVSVDDFRDRILDLKFGSSGYSYILDETGELILHPYLSGNVMEIRDTEGMFLVRELLKIKSGRLSYMWKNPGDAKPREKVVIFNHIPEYGWIVGSSGYTDEFYQPLTAMRNAIALLLIGCLLVGVPTSLVLVRSVRRPLEHLVDAMDTSPDSSFKRVEWHSRDEFGRLADQYNLFIDRIEQAQNDLHREVAQRRKAQQQLLIFREIFDSAMEGIVITDPNANILNVNPSFTRITGYTSEEAINANASILKSDSHDQSFYASMWQSLRTRGEWSGEIWNRRKNGEVYPEWLSISGIRDESDEITHFVSVFHDITEIKRKEEQIRFLAYHDALTQLPNRALLMDRLNMAIAHSRRNREKLALLFIDLDNFKNINDSMGHSYGDMMLREFSARAKEVVRESDTLARLGGDEFVVMAEAVDNERAVVSLADRLLDVFRTPFSLGGKDFHASASIGITVYPEDGDNADILIRNADMAMYWAKNSGKNRYHLFTTEMNERVTKRIHVEGSIREGLENNEFIPFLQPKIDLATGRVAGVEALARWKRADGDLESPAVFIPVAEETDLIMPIGEMILEKAIYAVQELHAQGHMLSLSVNLSSKQFDQKNLLDKVNELLASTGFDPSYLEFEITETVLMSQLDISLSNMHELARKGVKIAIDDFGTGYSSLYYLKKLPIDVIKIDRSFVMDIPHDSSDTQIVETIILLAKSLGLRIVAEGVETEEQVRFLKRKGCHEVQGFYFSKPLPLDELIARFDSGQLV